MITFGCSCVIAEAITPRTPEAPHPVGVFAEALLGGVYVQLALRSSKGAGRDSISPRIVHDCLLPSWTIREVVAEKVAGVLQLTVLLRIGRLQ